MKNETTTPLWGQLPVCTGIKIRLLLDKEPVPCIGRMELLPHYVETAFCMNRNENTTTIGQGTRSLHRKNGTTTPLCGGIILYGKELKYGSH
jgi:hypothetical protein